jgi:hypothetical protein
VLSCLADDTREMKFRRKMCKIVVCGEVAFWKLSNLFKR